MKDSVSSVMANIRPRVVGNKCILVKRVLSGPGGLVINKNVEVAPHDILGKSKLSSGFSAINLAELIKSSPSSALKYLQKPLGATIYKGELLAFKKTIFGKKYVIAPSDGIIEEYDPRNGELRLKFLPRDIPLTAGVFGIVEDVDKEKGEVVIKTLATEIYGLYGFGKERGGILRILGNNASLVDASEINDSMNKQIIVTGSLIYMEALRKTVNAGIQAVISGGLNLRDFASMTGTLNPNYLFSSDVGLTVVATEGFGPIPIGDDVFSELRKYEGKYVFTNGSKRQILLPSSSGDSILALRKIDLPKTALEDKPPLLQVGEIREGSRVRIIWPPLMGTQGIVISIDKTPTVLESGISIYMVAVETPRQKIKVPYPNLELIS